MDHMPKQQGESILFILVFLSEYLHQVFVYRNEYQILILISIHKNVK